MSFGQQSLSLNQFAMQMAKPVCWEDSVVRMR